MNIFDKIKKFCRPFRIILGLAIIAAGFFFKIEEEFYNMWYLLGLIPLVVGITGFCPLCMITKKCSV